MAQSRHEIVAWVGAHILPHEGDVRAWLRRSRLADDAVDDVVQEAYCRIAALKDVGHIEDGRAYLFRTVRNVALEQIRRARIVRLDSVTEIEALNVVDSGPSPEQVVAGRRELTRVQQLIEGLPERCREVFKLRRIQGVSQREIARRLGVTENVVEAQAVRGLKLILAGLAAQESERTQPGTEGHEQASKRHRDR